MEGSDEPLELRVSGAVLHGNLIMFDKESNTRWLQETGSAIDGQQKGKSLKELDDESWESNVRWDVWVKKYPESELLFCSHCMSRKTKSNLLKGLNPIRRTHLNKRTKKVQLNLKRELQSNIDRD